MTTRRHNVKRRRLRRTTLDELLDLGAAIGLVHAVAVHRQLDSDSDDEILFALIDDYVDHLDDPAHVQYVADLLAELPIGPL